MPVIPELWGRGSWPKNDGRRCSKPIKMHVGRGKCTCMHTHTHMHTRHIDANVYKYKEKESRSLRRTDHLCVA